MRTMLMASAAFFVPHAGNPATPPPRKPPQSVTRVQRAPEGVVTTFTTFRLPKEYAYEHIIQDAAREYHLDPDLIRAVIQTESAFDATAVSPVGAQGLMQLMPALSEELGVADPFDPRQNIMAGSKYLSWLMHVNDGNVKLALASYNAGPGAVARYDGIPPFKETQKYVKNIVNLLEESEE